MVTLTAWRVDIDQGICGHSEVARATGYEPQEQG